MEKNIAVIRGDGIGPEIVAQAVAVLERVAERFGHRFTFTEAEMGGCAIDRYGVNLPEESLRAMTKRAVGHDFSSFSWEELAGGLCNAVYRIETEEGKWS